MIPVAYIEHQLPGRVRLRVPSKRRQVPFFESVVQQLSKHPALREISASPLTGCITLRYLEPLQEITAAAAAQQLFQIGQVERQAAAGRSEGAAQPRRSPGIANEIATGLTGLSLLQVTQGNVLGSATENLWHAYSAQRILGRPDIAIAFVAIGLYQVLRGRLFGSAASLLFYAFVMRRVAAIEEVGARGHAIAAARAASFAKNSTGPEKGSKEGSKEGTGTETARSQAAKIPNPLSS